MKSSRVRLEARIADLFGYSEAVLFGRARSGVAALLQVLGTRDAAFVMPSNLCPDLVPAVHAAGAKVKLVGVGAASGLAEDAAFVAAMLHEERAGVVMPAHLYGFVQDYPRTLMEARARGWFVLENDTIATKARIGRASQAVFGDALVVSFGYAKTIDAGGGGALLCNDRALAQALRLQEQRYPPLDARAIEDEQECMRLVRQLRMRRTAQSALEIESLFLKRAPRVNNSFPDNLDAPLSAALNALAQTIDGRRRKAELWNRVLAPFDDMLLLPQADCAIPWRLIRRAPVVRNSIVAALRSAGMDAGTNFPVLTDSFPRLLAGERHDGAEQWAREVLNLWVTRAYDASRMKSAAKIIGRCLEQKAETRI